MGGDQTIETMAVECVYCHKVFEIPVGFPPPTALDMQGPLSLTQVDSTEQSVVSGTFYVCSSDCAQVVRQYFKDVDAET